MSTFKSHLTFFLSPTTELHFFDFKLVALSNVFIRQVPVAESIWCDSYYVHEFYIKISVLYSQIWQKKVSTIFKSNDSKFFLCIVSPRRNVFGSCFHRKNASLGFYTKFCISSPHQRAFFLTNFYNRLFLFFRCFFLLKWMEGTRDFLLRTHFLADNILLHNNLTSKK